MKYLTVSNVSPMFLFLLHLKNSIVKVKLQTDIRPWDLLIGPTERRIGRQIRFCKKDKYLDGLKEKFQ